MTGILEGRDFALQNPSNRQRVTCELACFLAQLHEAGIAHPDLHAGNLLLSMDQDQRPRFYLIDLHDIEIGSPLNWRASRDNLILLNRWAQLRTSYTDRCRFRRAYFAARPLLTLDVGRAMRRTGKRHGEIESCVLAYTRPPLSGHQPLFSPSPVESMQWTQRSRDGRRIPEPLARRS